MLGILGLGSYSTLYFIQRLNEVYNLQNGAYSTFPFIMLNVDFDKINPYLPNQFEVLKPKVEKELEQLLELGIANIVVPNITVHETIDQLDEKLRSMIIHPLKLAEKKALSLAKQNVLILGTRYTMESDYVGSFFQQLEHIKLTESQLELIDSIRKKVYKTGDSTILRDELLDCVNELIDESVLVVISCTELSVLGIKNENWIDLLELQIEEAMKTSCLPSL